MAKQTPCINKHSQGAAAKQIIWNGWSARREPTPNRPNAFTRFGGGAGVKWKHSCGSCYPGCQNCQLWGETNPGAE